MEREATGIRRVDAIPLALAAYNAWLQDPVIAYDNGPAFADTPIGPRWSGSPPAMSSSGGG
jgi:hypothetical protein